ncbi:hypothetical protein ACFQGT_02325 [Natrialbaceae archaeon GCM10025810]|uniref:hypothetical protein n=1 Tax=Halovalidus salilacus TaxID=3075124 RepID=UPI00360C2AA6
MKGRAVLAATIVGHVCLATLVTAHALATNREVGRWPALTLLFGVVGVAGYVRSDADSSESEYDRDRGTETR